VSTNGAWMALLSVTVSACAAQAAPSKSPIVIVCPTGTKVAFEGDSDVGWGEVERTEGCARADGKLEGPATQLVCSTPQLESTRLSGRFSNGRRVGTWTQSDTKTGAEIGRFTLDDTGSGVEVIKDQLGHFRRGTVVNGAREGAFTHHDRDGTLVATTTYSGGKELRTVGQVPWDPPMVDPSDMCPVVADATTVDSEGCPAAAPSSK
jgi:hypothetical protein